MLAVTLACVSGPGLGLAQPPTPTFARDVAPILYERCVTCHRPGQIAPMSLLTYKEARPWSRAIRARVAARTMPPWFAEDGHRPLAGDHRLNDNELMTLVLWVDAGAPEGSPGDLPPLPPAVAEAWRIGRVDAVVELPDAVGVPPSGAVPVQYFEVPTTWTDERWIEAVEVRPTDPAHVHQVNVFTRTVSRGSGTPVDPESPLGESLAAFASGAEPMVLPPGTARRMPAGSALVFEVHYSTNGSPGSDRTRLAMRFASRPPDREARTLVVANPAFAIPAGATEHRVEAARTFDEPVQVLSVMPHAHRRARRFDYRIVFPDGRAETILSVPRFNPLWELSYVFAEPLGVPRGARLEVTTTYDNSPANRANPDPRRDVAWGWDPAAGEMMTSYVVIAAQRKD